MIVSLFVTIDSIFVMIVFVTIVSIFVMIVSIFVMIVTAAHGTCIVVVYTRFVGGCSLKYR